tara:strand:- start:3631 stop:4290 length:660 start_codon:yes stop_codon:yes gene_type:complete
MDCLVGIQERRLLENINYNFDSLILDKIIYEYLYPKKKYLDELKLVTKYFKIVYIIDSYNYYDFNQKRIIQEVNNKCNIIDKKIKYYEIFKNFYMDYKECVISVKKSFNYNKFDDFKSMKNDIKTKLKLLKSTIHSTEFLRSIILIDTAIMIRSNEKLITDMYDFYMLQRENFVSQLDYIEALSNLNYMLDDYLSYNNMTSYDLYDLTYCEKLEIFRTL